MLPRVPRVRIVLPPGELTTVEDRVPRTMRKAIIWGAVTLAVVVAVFLAQSNKPIIFLVSSMVIFSIIAMSMNIQSGYASLFNLAIGGITGIGAYVGAYAMTSWGYPFWIVLPVAGVMSAGVGFILALPSLRLKGLYFGLMSIMIQLLMGEIFNDWIGFTGGSIGRYNLPPLNTGFNKQGDTITGIYFIYLGLAVLVVWALLLRKLTRGRQGLALSAVRFDDELAGFLGVNVTRQKMLVFVISSFFAGVAGAMLAAITGFINPDTVSVFLSAQILIMMFVGGFATFWGPIVGAMIMTVLPQALVSLYAYTSFIYGTFLVVVILFFRGGIMGTFNRYRRNQAKKKERMAAMNATGGSS